ncbi:type 1 fimbrial protein [Escherichia marmotae]|uniref:fimbrial protein n=1 Tax=Escherichia marmotae TaxID=1499973 RepID=UPI002813E0F4|nr:fimbrial protein [Escherichia marmotae]MDQ9240765.1 type 1 fimbrial protein [Escherichia marmotae]MDQ9274201.1 type 1 fimbrial protein [Escherichia marmotae]MEC9822498.1 fimbrial protein [Escherichia marmotae]MED0331832.1 fimbrial protein [Escherichia marmotae]
MKKYWFLFLLALPFWGQAKCTLGPNTVAYQTIELDMTSGTATIPINTNFYDTFSCNGLTDEMYYATPLNDYIVELKEPGTSKSIFMKFNLKGEGFPVSTGIDSWNSSPKEFNTQDVINTKQFTLEATYVESSDSVNYTSSNSDFIDLNNPAISILTDNSCNKNLFFWLICLATGKLEAGVSYAQYLKINVKHKPTTCRFSQPTYEIRMPETTISEMQSANNTKSGSIDLVLNCDSVYNVTTNPVSFKVARGEWDDSGTILKNTLPDGAKGVGFQIYNGSATTPLKLGDTLMNKLTKMAAIENQYTFPITAKYVRVKEEAIQPGEVQSKAIFAVSYD